MKYSFLLLFLCLSYLAGQESAAQSDHDSLQKIANRYYSLSGLNMSEDGNWFTIRILYDLNSDTVLFFSSRNPGQPLCYRTMVKSLVFLSNNNLLMQEQEQAELFTPETQTGIRYKNVKEIKVLKGKELFLLHYNEEDKNRLELRDKNGQLLNETDHVRRFYTTDSNQIYAITENENSRTVVILLNGKIAEPVYLTSRKISYLEPDPGGHGIMVHEQNSVGDSMEILYLDLATGTIFPLNETLPILIQNGFSEVICEGNIYFLKLLVHGETADTSLPDIWYGNDNHLEEKFYPVTPDLRYVWEPKEKTVRQIGNDSLTTNINTGSDRYFLSFDPFYFQDYTSETIPLKLYVYDKARDHYSVLDTIGQEFYLSGNGMYCLSSKDRQWNLYHIPSGMKKQIPGIGPGTPWFTNDGKSVLFESDESLWKYELESGVLDVVITYEGYGTKIINGQWEGISTRKGRFCKQQVNIGEPLLIKLYNTNENATSYVLWHKGKSGTIVPPTSRHIQSLNYNKSYACFSWIEEDFDLPPQLVYKKMEGDEKVLYQSNKADTAILSLKQEVISYTNRNSVPLKGILYYPLNYNPSEKYPMVVHIYEKQRHLSNRYLLPSYYNGLGFNIRLLLEKGYFVYLPDILIQGKEDKGPGLDALDCVNNALDATTENQSIDKQRIGLIGHSFGAYETDFISTHSNRFATYVSGSGQSDILRAYHSFNYNFKWPDYVRVEANQYKMGMPFSRNKTLYFSNNPIYYAEKVNAPFLLWSGLEDKNVTSDQSMAFYNALRRNGKDVIVLFYKGERHSLQQKHNQMDLTIRILDWYDYFLKDNIEINWVSKGMSKRRAQ